MSPAAAASERLLPHTVDAVVLGATGGAGSALTRRGPAGSPAVILVHSLGMTRCLWDVQLHESALAQRYRLIAPDLPGHGALVRVPFRMDTAVRHLADVIDREAAGRALVVGLSLGGYVSMALAARYPAKVSGLVLASCSAVPRGLTTLPFRVLGWLIRALGDRWYAALNTLLFRRTLPPRTAEAQVRAGFYFGALPDVADELVGEDARRWLTAYPGPVLLLNGARDPLFRRHERAFLAACAAARCEVLPRAAHLCNLDEPDAFARAVLEFAHAIGWDGSRGTPAASAPPR
jgi:pimeloyl-ACP methyl ester carboxylesterase